MASGLQKPLKHLLRPRLISIRKTKSPGHLGEPGQHYTMLYLIVQ